VVNVIEKYSDEVKIENNKLLNRFINFKYLTNRSGMINVIKELIKLNPTVLYSRPSDLMEYMRYMKENNLKLTKLRMIFSSSELLTDGEREIIENFFRCDIYDIYGNSEFKEIAWQCKRKKYYHINSDSVYVEFIKDGKHTKSAEDADLVVTSLHNKSMPLIRYFNDDRGVYTDSVCECGCEFPLIEKIIGRKADYFYLKNGTSIAPHVTIKAIRIPLEELM